MFSGLLSPWHVAIFVLVLMLVFGPARLPGILRSVSRTVRDVRAEIDAVNPIAPVRKQLEELNPLHVPKDGDPPAETR